MRFIKRVRKIFSSMPLREKIAAIVLGAIFLTYFGQAIISSARFPLKREKDIFAEGVVGRVKNINPLFVDFNDADRDISQLVFSGLIKYDPVKKNFFPDLAQNWERSGNGLSYTFTLRTDALWHDQTPVTADDIIFTFRDVIQNPGFRNPMLKNAFEGVSVNITAPNTVTFVLPKANSYFISNLTVGILPKHLLADIPAASLDKSSFGQHPVGSGPYVLNSLKLDPDGDIADLSAFQQYYGSPKPSIEKIRIYTFPDEEMMLEEKNALHSLSKLSWAAGQEIAADPRFSTYQYSLNQFTALFFNTENEFLKEKKVRQALALALNKTALLNEGEQRVDALDLQEHASDTAFAFFLDGAKKILDELNLKPGADGIRLNASSERMSLNLLSHSKIPDATVEKIKNMWRDLGIDIQVTRADKDFYQAVVGREYDILLMRQNLGYNRDVYPLFHSSQIGSQGLNFSNFRSFRTDGITEAIRKEKDSRDKEKLLTELSNAIADEIPVIFLSTPVYSYALDKKVEAFPAQNLDFHSDRFSLIPYLQFQSINTTEQ